MPNPADDRIIQSIRMYRETLKETEQLFVESGQLVRGSYGWLPGQDEQNVQSIADEMHDLHQGFLMKIFATVVPDTQSRTLEQRQLGRVLLEHIWGTSVMGNLLRESVDRLVATAEGFQWRDLVRPFAEIPAIRDRWGELETSAMRMAKLLATADGSLSLVDNQRLAIMRQEFDRLQTNSPDHLASELDTANARDALKWLHGEAKRLREGMDSSAAHPKYPTPDHPIPEQPTPEQPVPTTNLGSLPPSSTRSPTTPKPASQPAPTVDDRTPAEHLADARAKLDRLIGLDAVKDQIETLTNFLKMERQREKAGLPTTKPSLHMAFVGNPGTGKTTVARIVAEIYGALGVLEKGHLIETDRSGLVAEYAGQTGPKTNAKIDEALDGVLFIDEAYTLIDESGQDQYGREAVQTLLKRMEDQRNRLVVILAGYPNEMQKMIRSNPGLSSRVGSTMHFDDYPPQALCGIYELIASKAKYMLPTESRRRLLRGFTFLYSRRDRHFGNGRCSRNSFERSVRRLANRLAKIDDVSHELLTTLEPEDIEVAGVLPAHLAAMADMKGHVRLTCDHCEAAQIIDDQCLGTSVTCGSCDKLFDAKWGEPVAELPGPVAEPPEEIADGPEQAAGQ
ncbi:MAG: AAA family ATPase [Planctomycetota bacterium]|nr:AAA family ATPase [Planctomycetota bacterium]